MPKGFVITRGLLSQAPRGLYYTTWCCVTQDFAPNYKARIQDDDVLIFAMDPSSLASELGKKFREVLDRAE